MQDVWEENGKGEGLSSAPRYVSLRSESRSWQEFTSAAELAAWEALSQNAAEPNVFLESWYLLPALRSFDKHGEVKLYLLWEGETLVGLMPISAERRYGNWPIPSLQNWTHPNAFLGTPLVRSGYEMHFWNALFASLDKSTGNALFFHLNGADCDGPVVAALQEVCAEQNRRQAKVHHLERALLRRGLSPDAYFEAAVRGKKRKELRRQKNRLLETGELAFTRSNNGDGLEDWTNDFLALERCGWKGAAGSALDCADETRSLFREALVGAAKRDMLERLDLRLDGKPLAMLVNFMRSPGAFSYKTAFDEDLARFSPGVLLQIENLALLNREDTNWCDSCAAEGHPMIDSLWTDRRAIGRYSVAIGGAGRRMLFKVLLSAEQARSRIRKPTETAPTQTNEEDTP